MKASKAAVEASMEAMARLQKDQVARIVELEGQLKASQAGRTEGTGMRWCGSCIMQG